MMIRDDDMSSLSDWPSAIHLAKLEDVLFNNNVLHWLVKPTPDGTEVVSVNHFVNVVPHRRIYRFDHKEEVDNFTTQLLQRPLVLQPVSHFGRGLFSGDLSCGMCYGDEKWVVMVNQTHPKILGRLQIGLDTMKAAMVRGQSCEITFGFSKVVEKIHKRSLRRSERAGAVSTMDLIKSCFRYVEWEYGDLVMRYHGYAGLLGRGGGLRDMRTHVVNFNFEDLSEQEIEWKSLGAEFFSHPHLATVSEDDIRECLPLWTINGISPMDECCETKSVYSYERAERLYASFRKQKRQLQQCQTYLPGREMISSETSEMESRPTALDGYGTHPDNHSHFGMRSTEPSQHNVYSTGSPGRELRYTELARRDLPSREFAGSELHSAGSIGRQMDTTDNLGLQTVIPNHGTFLLPSTAVLNSRQRSLSPRDGHRPVGHGIEDRNFISCHETEKYDAAFPQYLQLASLAEADSDRMRYNHANGSTGVTTSAGKTDRTHLYAGRISPQTPVRLGDSFTSPARSSELDVVNPGVHRDVTSCSRSRVSGDRVSSATSQPGAKQPCATASQNSDRSGSRITSLMTPASSYPADDESSRRFYHQRVLGSDRSFQSDVTDSGICSDSDARRNGSYDKHGLDHAYAMDNHGFYGDGGDEVIADALRKHRQLIASCIAETSFMG